MANKLNKERKSEIEVPMHFDIPFDMPSRYATNLIIQVGETEVFVSFFEAQPPLLPPGTKEEQVAALQKIGIRAVCVAKLAIPKSKFLSFVEVFKKFEENVVKENA